MRLFKPSKVKEQLDLHYMYGGAHNYNLVIML
jgi:hypothetical protein